MSEQPEHVKLGLSWIDITIVAVYLVVIVIVGLLSGKLQSFIQRRSRIVKPPTNDHQELNDEETNATQTDLQTDVPPETTETQENAPAEEPKMNEVDEYFLGSRSIPWWALAASGMASNLDVSGTMINCAMIYALGVRGMLIEMRGGLTLALAFLMAFLGKWHRRSGVMTPAEWMILRFGEGRQGDVARLSTAITSILYSIGHITYFAVGSGIFMAEFFDIPDLIGIRREFWAAIIMTTLSMIYTVATGLSGVVWTDVFQGFTIFAAIIIVCIKAMVTVTLPTTFQISSLLYNGTSVIQTTTWSDWSSPLPVWKLDFDANSQYSVYNMFGIAIMLYASKLFLEGFGGPTGYAAQRYFAAKDEKDAARMTGLWIFLLSFRWPFIVAVCMLGIYFGNGYGGQVIPDPEIVLPRVIASMLPVGVKGIVVAAMISAAMSTFDSTVNAAAAIVVKDVYHAYIHKNASQKVLILVGRVSSIVLVCVAMLFMLAIKNVNDVWGWITMSLGAGMIIPYLMRWYWYRTNGYGYGASLFIGACFAIVAKIIFTATGYELPEYYTSVIISVISFISCVIVSLLTPATSPDVLVKFYALTQPFGIWYPVKRRFKATFTKEIMKDSIWDLVTLAAALPWQYLLYIVWMAIVMQAWIVFGVSSIIVVILSVVLYFTWLRRLNYQSLNKRQVEYNDEDEGMPVELEDVTADTETMVDESEDQKVM